MGLIFGTYLKKETESNYVPFPCIHFTPKLIAHYYDTMLLLDHISSETALIYPFFTALIFKYTLSLLQEKNIFSVRPYF
jgi:hypothetical protein